MNPHASPTLPTNPIPTTPVMQKFEYEFWQCGHVTRIKDGKIVIENGDLARLPRQLVPRHLILKNFGDACPRCYTERVLQRLQSIKLLLFDCNNQHEAVKMADKRVTALTEYLLSDPGTRFLAEEGGLVNYPVEFEVMMRHVIELGIEVHTSACEDFAAARRCLRSRVSPRFVDRINGIRDNAQLYFTMGDTPVVRECMARIVNETMNMLKQMQEYEKEELFLLFNLDVKAAGLKVLLEEYLESKKRRSEALKKPEF
ncbi:hypothetical protein F4782DRAFT_317174 [Xylaria castorea]|nr:hypothetical protein F4782DRAFT_317174 [Xylaria castorea]